MATRAVRCHQLWQSRRQFDRIDDANFGSRHQRYAEKVGLDPAAVGAHSLRSGFLTEAAKAGASLPKMQEVSRQKKVEVLLGYVRDAALFENHAGEGFL